MPLMKYWEIIADKLSAAGGRGAASQPSILAGKTMPRNTTQTLERM